MGRIKAGTVVFIEQDDGSSYGLIVPEGANLSDYILTGNLPDDALWTERQQSKNEIVAQIDAAITDYQTALDNWATLTAAQQKAVLKRLVEVDIRILRMLKSDLT